MVDPGWHRASSYDNSSVGGRAVTHHQQSTDKGLPSCRDVASGWGEMARQGRAVPAQRDDGRSARGPRHSPAIRPCLSMASAWSSVALNRWSKCGLERNRPRSPFRSGAGHLARATVIHIIRCTGRAPCRSPLLSSNVGPRAETESDAQVHQHESPAQLLRILVFLLGRSGAEAASPFHDRTCQAPLRVGGYALHVER